MQKTILLICAVVALVGCGGGTPDLTAQPKLEKAIRKHLVEARGVMPTGKLTKEDFDKVTSLDLRAANLGDAGLKEVAKLTKLTFLNLYHNQLTSVKGLEKLTQLEELMLMDNQLTDVKGLEKLTQLEQLGLSRNQLTDVKGLEKLTQLEELLLTDNPALTKAQIDQLQKALPKCYILSNPTK